MFPNPYSMTTSRKECLECIQLNISLVRRYLSGLTSFEKTELFKELNDIFYFYNFSKEDVLGFINHSGNFAEYDDDQLLEIEGVINAILFQLKYK